jgi:hypothetical protein
MMTWKSSNFAKTNMQVEVLLSLGCPFRRHMIALFAVNSPLMCVYSPRVLRDFYVATLPALSADSDLLTSFRKMC